MFGGKSYGGAELGGKRKEERDTHCLEMGYLKIGKDAKREGWGGVKQDGEGGAGEDERFEA